MNRSTVVRRVDFTNRGSSRFSDFHVAFLGSLGFSTKFIMQETGLTFSQVIYRLGKADVKRARFRNGEGKMAQAVIRSTRPSVTPLIERHIRNAIINEQRKNEAQAI